MFSIVVFEKTETRPEQTGLVPRCWIIDKEKCAWPPSLDPTAAARNSHKPFDTSGKLKKYWNIYKYRMLKSFDNYDAARAKLERSEFTSDLSDADDLLPLSKRRPKPTAVSSSSEDENDSLPPAPKLPKLYSSPVSDLHDEEFVLALVNQNESESVTTPSRIKKVSCKRTNVSSDPTPTGNCWTLNDIGAYMVKKFAEVKERQMQIDSKLNALLTTREKPKLQMPERVYEKATDVEEFDELETKLAEEDYRTAVIANLAEIGGNNCYETVQSAMKSLLHDDVLRMFSLHGRKGKMAFQKTHVYDVVLLTSKLNERVKMDEADIRKAIASVFRHV